MRNEEVDKIKEVISTLYKTQSNDPEESLIIFEAITALKKIKYPPLHAGIKDIVQSYSVSDYIADGLKNHIAIDKELAYFRSAQDNPPLTFEELKQRAKSSFIAQYANAMKDYAKSISV